MTTEPLTVSNVKITLIPSEKRDKRGYLRAFVVVEISCGEFQFVARDLRIVCGPSGKLKVCMPSRIYDAHCPACQISNVIAARYCNSCGIELPRRSYSVRENGGFIRGYDTFFPTNQATRELIEEAIIAAYYAAVDALKDPDKDQDLSGDVCNAPHESNGILHESTSPAAESATAVV